MRALRQPVKLALLVLGIVLLLPRDAAAQQSGHPFQLSLINPIQIVPESQSVAGIRLAVFHSRNANVLGFDWTWIGLSETTGNFTGVAFVGFAGHIVQGEVTGWQATVVNVAGRGLSGAQTGGINVADGKAGVVQLGLVNVAQDFTGLQLGVVNFTRRMKGVQIGLANIITEGPLPFMVIANASF
jgi:hypothetical protein